MYPPKHHQNNNLRHLIEVINHYPLATIISIDNDGPLITHLPLIYRDHKLIGHIDKNNPHANFLKNGNQITIIFSGPDAYISPSIFDNKTHLPTWNYIKIHVKGNVNAIEDEQQLKKDMMMMTEFLEQPEVAYKLEADDPKMSQFINYISGFEIDITSWEGKFKLSKDKSQEDINIASKALVNSQDKNLAELIKRLLNNNGRFY